jgi:hypothetical protein
MVLVLVMLVLHTIHKAVSWYQTWLAFIFYGDDLVKGTMIIQGIIITPTLNAIYTMQDLLNTLRLGIADGIMVSLSHPLVVHLTGLIVWFRCGGAGRLTSATGKSSFFPLFCTSLLLVCPALGYCRKSAHTTTAKATGLAIVFMDIILTLIPMNIYFPLAMATYALSVASTVLSTILIVVRILYVARIPGTTRQPLTVIEIVVESAALYSISALIYIVMLYEWIANSSLMDLYGEIFCSNMAVSKSAWIPYLSVLTY